MEQERSPEELESVWSRYGLKESPYSTSPMRLLGILPINKVFSGRNEEVAKLKGIINSKNSTRTLIIGDFGIGKTTFTNYVRWSLSLKRSDSKYLTTSSEIKVQPDWDANTFLLSTLSAIYTSSIIFKWESKGIKLRSMNQLKDYVSIGKQRNFQGSFAGFGGGYGESKTIPNHFSPEILENLLMDICKEIMEHGKQIIIPYDNLENIEYSKLSNIFRSIRDYLQIEGFHSLFIGPPPVISALEAHGQVYSVFGQPLLLEPLSENNVLEILKKRCEILKLEIGRYITPYDEKTVKELYKKLNKNIRFTFKVLEDATLVFQLKAPCKIAMDEILAVQEKEKKEILSRLTETQEKIISALIPRDNVTQTELARITGVGRTNLTIPVRELRDKGLLIISKDKNDRRMKWIKLSNNSYLRLFFNSEELNKK